MCVCVCMCVCERLTSPAAEGSGWLQELQLFGVAAVKPPRLSSVAHEGQEFLKTQTTLSVQQT